MVLPLEPTRVRRRDVLTRDEELFVELVKPLSSHLDLKGPVLHLVRGIADLVGVFDDRLHVFRAQRVQYREEVVTCGALLPWVRVGEEAHDLLVISEERVDVLHGKLVELWHVDEAALGDG